MKTTLVTTALCVVLGAALPLHAADIALSITTPDKVETSIAAALAGDSARWRTPDHKLDWAFLRPQAPVKFTEGTGKVMNTIPPNDFSYFEMINEVVQKEPAEALDPEIMGSLAVVGIVKGKPFNPDARMKQILTGAATIGTAVGRTLNWRSRPSEGFYYYPGSAWMNMLFVGATTWKRRRHRSARKAPSPQTRPPVTARSTRARRCSSTPPASLPR